MDSNIISQEKIDAIILAGTAMISSILVKDLITMSPTLRRYPEPLRIIAASFIGGLVTEKAYKQSKKLWAQSAKRAEKLRRQECRKFEKEKKSASDNDLVKTDDELYKLARRIKKLGWNSPEVCKIMYDIKKSIGEERFNDLCNNINHISGGSIVHPAKYYDHYFDTIDAAKLIKKGKVLGWQSPEFDQYLSKKCLKWGNEPFDRVVDIAINLDETACAFFKDKI